MRQVARLRGGAHVERQHHRVGRLGELDVAFGDLPDRGVQHADLHLLVRQLQHRGLDRLRAALHVGLDQHRDFLLLAGLDAGQHLVERAARAGRHAGRLVAQLAGAELGDLAGAAFVLHRDERLAGRRHAGQAEDLHRRRWSRLGDRAGLVVQHGAHPAPLGAGDHDVALPQRALLHQHRRHRTAAAVQPAFDHRAFGGALRIGLQVEDFRLQRDRLGQLVEAGLLGRGNLHVLRLAAHLLDHDLVAEQFLADAAGIGVLLVHLVDGDDQRRAGRLGVADRLDGLRHHAVVRRHHQHHDVGDGGAAGAHGGERLVARRVDEGDLLARRHLAPGRRRYAG